MNGVQDLLDYAVDSDDEWVEDESGESVCHSEVSDTFIDPLLIIMCAYLDILLLLRLVGVEG